MTPFIVAGIVVVLAGVLAVVALRRRGDRPSADPVPAAASPLPASRAPAAGPGARTVVLADGGEVVVRRAAPDDCARVADLANALDREVGDGSAPHTAATVQRDMLGGAAGLVLWVVAPAGGAAQPVAYALVQDMYDTDSASWATWLHDLYVAPNWRDREVGAHLMAHLAQAARASGHSGLWWGVHRNNLRAERFYRGLDAHRAPIHVMGVAGPTLEALAARAT